MTGPRNVAPRAALPDQANLALERAQQLSDARLSTSDTHAWFEALHVGDVSVLAIASADEHMHSKLRR
jgi:hypothetical protein